MFTTLYEIEVLLRQIEIVYMYINYEYKGAGTLGFNDNVDKSCLVNECYNNTWIFFPIRTH